MVDLSQVTYCGLYCGLCAQRNRIPARAAALREAMQQEGWEQWGGELPQFEAFWEFLRRLGASEADCSCRGDRCGPPFCAVRKCAREKGVDACPFCAEYPCGPIEELAAAYVQLLGDGKHMAAIGLQRWIAEQEARKATGFCYADIRCPHGDTPDA